MRGLLLGLMLSMLMTTGAAAQANTSPDKIEIFFLTVNFELEHCRSAQRISGFEGFYPCAEELKKSLKKSYKDLSVTLKTPAAKREFKEYYVNALTALDAIPFLSGESVGGYASRQATNNRKLSEAANRVKIERD